MLTFSALNAYIQRIECLHSAQEMTSD